MYIQGQGEAAARLAEQLRDNRAPGPSYSFWSMKTYFPVPQGSLAFDEALWLSQLELPFEHRIN